MSGSSSDFESEGEDEWIPWFCALKGNELFCEVDEAYVQDNFNLVGLEKLVDYYEQALDMITDNFNQDGIDHDQHEQMSNDAEVLYGLVHARYILTAKGLNDMYQKFRAAEFGQCCRVLCGNHPLLPVGLSDHPQQDCVKLYCGRCNEVYHTRSAKQEGERRKGKDCESSIAKSSNYLYHRNTTLYSCLLFLDVLHSQKSTGPFSARLFPIYSTSHSPKRGYGHRFNTFMLICSLRS